MKGKGYKQRKNTGGTVKNIRDYGGKKEREARRKRKKQADKELRRKGYSSTGEVKKRRKGKS